ncbi:MAG: UDP-N-acetylmuramate dehydrogenase [Selenomonadaceae bacterium]|nr:UDP-N-acetylmuramate dehydrogenase [Selenomonadaceae bacterium]MBQ7630624.1 UDP-N-acetylmuramate dehydrogenase [Selenomonadaceae bacterium]
MDLEDAFKNKLAETLRSDQFIFHAPMSEHTTFKIGGAADVLIFPSTVAEVAAVIKLTEEFNLPCTILGNGSNVLILDRGIRGVVVKFSDKFFGNIRVDGTKIFAGAGALLKDVSNFAATNSLSGLEFAVGIPGSIGGAVYMNAGAYGGEMKNIIAKVTAISKSAEILTFDAESLCLGYRQSIFQQNGCAICEVELNLTQGNFDEIKNLMDDFTQRRQTKQPLEFPSAGSTFKRPKGYFAGTLIDKTGLKGLKVGGAMVSEKHAGFVVNAGGATAQDVLNLIEEVRRRVNEVHGVTLTPEVRILGE